MFDKWSLSRDYIFSTYCLYCLYIRNEFSLSGTEQLKFLADLKNSKKIKIRKTTKKKFFIPKKKKREICFSLIIIFPELFRMIIVFFNTYFYFAYGIILKS